MNAETQLDKSSEKVAYVRSNDAKNVFISKTVWGIVFTTVAAIAPIVGKDIDQSRNNQPVNYGQDVAQIIVIISGAAATICGRIDAKGSIYTPNWLPGPNKSDFQPKS